MRHFILALGLLFSGMGFNAFAADPAEVHECAVCLEEMNLANPVNAQQAFQCDHNQDFCTDCVGQVLAMGGQQGCPLCRAGRVERPEPVQAPQVNHNYVADLTVLNRGQNVPLVRYENGQLIFKRAREVNNHASQTSFTMRVSTRRFLDSLVAPCSKLYSRLSGKGAEGRFNPFKAYLPLQVNGTTYYVNANDLNNFLYRHGYRRLTAKEISAFSCQQRTLRRVQNRFEGAFQRFVEKHKIALKSKISEALQGNRNYGLVRLAELRHLITESLTPDLASRTGYYQDEEIRMEHVTRLQTIHRRINEMTRSTREIWVRYKNRVDASAQQIADTLDQPFNVRNFQEEDLNSSVFVNEEANRAFCQRINEAVAAIMEDFHPNIVHTLNTAFRARDREERALRNLVSRFPLSTWESVAGRRDLFRNLGL